MDTAEHLTWFKSSRSGAEGGQCIEVAASAGAVHVRDSKDMAGLLLHLSRDARTGFVGLATAK
ncbi:DUF397 domain-containing protein [Streptomyces sp. NPDC016469]|uniref:DUF397 domain-containing protein n=1 Tax=Streptomyces sp. NPDC016469 TaxID=3157191 RepID=UPI0033DC37E6